MKKILIFGIIMLLCIGMVNALSLEDEDILGAYGKTITDLTGNQDLVIDGTVIQDDTGILLNDSYITSSVAFENFNDSNNFTISFLAYKSTGEDSYQGLLDLFNADTGFYFYTYGDTEQSSFRYYNTTAGRTPVGYDFPLNTWQRITVIKNETHFMFCEDNTCGAHETVGIYEPANTNDLIFGYSRGYIFNGYLKDIVLINRSISETEVTQLNNLFLDINFISNSTIDTSNYTLKITNFRTDLPTCKSSRNSEDYVTMTNIEGNNYTYDYTGMDFGNTSFTVNCSNTTDSISQEYTVYRNMLNLSENNISYTNSDGLEIYYDLILYKNDSSTFPVYIVSDTWSQTRAGMTDWATEWAENGYFVINMDTRGKGDSEGSLDASGWECLDIYEMVQHVKNTYSEYVDPDRIYLNGLSGAGGKTLNCVGKMPDTFTAVQGVASVSNYTMWEQIDGTSAAGRIGSTYIENPEAYKARNGAWTAYNTPTPIQVIHGDADISVNVNLSRAYNATVSQYDGVTIEYIEVPGMGHSWGSEARPEGETWFSTYNTPVSLPSVGDLRIGIFLRTKLFDITLADDKIGTVEYDFSGSDWIMNLSTATYTGAVNVTIKDIANDINVYDNEVLIATLQDSNLSYSMDNYSVNVSDGDLYFEIPHMSEHNISGEVEYEEIIPPTPVEEGIKETLNTSIVAFGLIALFVIVGGAMMLISIFSSGGGTTNLMAAGIGFISLAVILLIGYLILGQVATGLMYIGG